MARLPEDVIIDILTRLPVKPIFRFRCVRKSWQNLIKNPNFVKLQRSRSLEYGDQSIVYKNSGKLCCIDYDSSSSTLSNTITRIDYPSGHTMKRNLGSCNGLLCYESHQKDIIMWNPYTKDHKQIPAPPTPAETDTESRRFQYMYGFGYDLKTGDFKVARMANIQGKYSEIAVYSLKSNLWKTYPDIPFLHPFGDLSEDLVFCEGVFHWVEMPWGNVLPRMIGSFDIGSETFKEIPLPQSFPDKDVIHMIHVRQLEGCLCLLGSVYMKYCEVWVMKDYGVHESWVKKFTIGKKDLGGLGYLDLKHFKNDVILVNAESWGSYLYDHKNLTKLEINPNYPPQTQRGRRAWPISRSLVSPNVGTCLAMQ